MGNTHETRPEPWMFQVPPRTFDPRIMNQTAYWINRDGKILTRKWMDVLHAKLPGHRPARNHLLTINLLNVLDMLVP